MDVDVVGMVQVASQRCHFDVRCNRHEAHQCHLVERGKIDVREGCVGVVVAI